MVIFVLLRDVSRIDCNVKSQVSTAQYKQDPCDVTLVIIRYQDFKLKNTKARFYS